MRLPGAITGAKAGARGGAIRLRRPDSAANCVEGKQCGCFGAGAAAVCLWWREISLATTRLAAYKVRNDAASGRDASTTRVAMSVFNRKHPSKVILGGQEGKADEEAVPAQPQPQTPTKPAVEKETPMDKSGAKNQMLQDIMPGRKGPGAESAPLGAGGGAAPSSSPATIVSGDTMIDGKIVAKGELRIDGTFKGEIASSSQVIVGTNGKVEATIEAKQMTISGRVKGNLRIQERLELLATGELFGDLETQPGALIIEKGARLEGRCTMGLKDSPGEGGAKGAGPASGGEGGASTPPKK